MAARVTTCVQFSIKTLVLLVLSFFFVCSLEARQFNLSNSELSSYLLEVTGKCVRLLKTDNQEKLINTCNTCRLIQVRRERSGVLGPPDLRSFTILEGRSYTLSFKGPGRTRLLTEQPCFSPSERSIEAHDQMRPDPGSTDCIQAVKVKNIGVGLANLCSECRSVLLERTKSGGSSKTEVITIPAKSLLNIESRGFSAGRLLSEGQCR